MSTLDRLHEDAYQASLLQDTYENLTGRLLGAAQAKRYIAAGLDAGIVLQVSLLAAHAIAINSPYARYAYRRDPSAPLSQTVTAELFTDLDRRISQHFTRHARSQRNARLALPVPSAAHAVPQMLAWAEVLAILPDPGEMARLWDALPAMAPIWTATFGDLAPLIAAAGMSRADAEEFLADGSLDADGLYALATLRGIVWSPR